MPTPYLDQVARFYKVTQAGYDFAVSRDYLRYGLWDDATRTAAESLVNTDRLVADLLQLGGGGRAPSPLGTRLRVPLPRGERGAGPQDAILDAGCGVGGSAIYFARTFGARVTGVNICKSQLDKARQKAHDAGLDDLVCFEERDFCATGLADGAFTKAYAIESMYHAESCARLVAEVYRVLAAGGRIAVVDRFLLRDELSPPETRLYDRFRSGQVVAQLPTVAAFRGILESAGFARIEFHDKLQAILPGIARTQRMCVLSYPLSYLVTALRILPRELHSQTVGLMAIRRLFAEGVVTYGAFAAEKP